MRFAGFHKLLAVRRSETACLRRRRCESKLNRRRTVWLFVFSFYFCVRSKLARGKETESSSARVPREVKNDVISDFSRSFHRSCACPLRTASSDFAPLEPFSLLMPVSLARAARKQLEMSLRDGSVRFCSEAARKRLIDAMHFLTVSMQPTAADAIRSCHFSADSI